MSFELCYPAGENDRARELRLLLQQSHAQAKPSVGEMRAWVEHEFNRTLGSADACRTINSVFEDAHVRSLAVATALIGFLDLCIANQDDIRTVFRATAHREQHGHRRRA